MNITVFGCWHLGTVTAACLAAAGHRVTGLDPDAANVAKLNDGKAPLLEPGLDDLIARGIKEGRLTFTTDVAKACAEADLVWVCFDTPVDENDVADVAYVVRETERTFPYLRKDAVLAFSSQLPVGTTMQVAAAFEAKHSGKNVGFAYVPENLRLGKAIEVFTKPDRFVVGATSPTATQRLKDALAPITDRLETMSVESAEMTKHAINSFLAMCVVYANELATLCEQVGADAKEVARGLKSEMRIGKYAYVSPGTAFAGGTLARDVRFLETLSGKYKKDTPLFQSILKSNEAHKQWVVKKLREVFANVEGRTFAVLGLTYKPDTSTLRRSSSVETCQAIHAAGGKIRAYDPGVTELPPELSFITLAKDAPAAMQGADAVVVQTQWPQFKTLAAGDVTKTLRQPVVVDPTGHLDHLREAAGVRHYAIGRSSRNAQG